MTFSDIANLVVLKTVAGLSQFFFTDSKNLEETVASMENLTQGDPVIFAYFPHTIFIDAVIAGLPYYRLKGHPFPAMAKDKHVDNKLYGWFLRNNVRIIRVDHHKDYRKTLPQIIEGSKEVLAEELDLAAFPEGTRWHPNLELYEQWQNSEISKEELIEKIKIGYTFLQIAFETEATLVPVKLTRSGLLGFRFRYFVGSPRTYTSENTDLKPRNQFEKDIQYWRQFQGLAKELLLEVYGY